jgi:RNA polymerase sigma factor (TIGR02999 family)
MLPVKHDLTQLLEKWSAGDQSALDNLLPEVYDDLHRLAESYLRRERQNHTLQATALINEVYLRFAGSGTVSWQNRAHFFGVAARLMRQILVDYARKRGAAKRGDAASVALEEAVSFLERRDLNLVALDDALKDLAAFDERQSRIVELRFFGGLTIEETAEVIDLSPATVKVEWSLAKAWLLRELSRT